MRLGTGGGGDAKTIDDLGKIKGIVFLEGIEYLSSISRGVQRNN